MTTADKMTPCAACGAQVAAGSVVCVQCGAVVQASVGTLLRESGMTAPSAPSAPAPVSAPAPRGTGAIAAAATAATVAAAAATQISAASRAVSPPQPARRSSVTLSTADTMSAGRLTPHQAEMVHTLAEAVGVTESEAARVFADSADNVSLPRRPRMRRRGVVTVVIVLAFLGMQAWRCFDERITTTYQTSPYGYDASGGGSTIPSAGDRAELRRLLDDLMAVNASLPQTVDEPVPVAAQQAAELGRELRKWKRTHEASPDDELLAAAGARFAFALAGWVDDPNASGTYEAYDRAWNAWDAVDDTWETAAE